MKIRVEDILIGLLFGIFFIPMLLLYFAITLKSKLQSSALGEEKK